MHKSQRMLDMLKQVKEISIILAVAVGLAIITNSFSSSGIPLIGQWDLSKGVVSAKTTDMGNDSGFEIDNVNDAKIIYDKGETVFIDARSKESYEDGHIKGAFSFPVNEFDNLIDNFLSRYPINMPIIIYCGGRTCEDSHSLAQMLMDLGYEQIRVMIDGFPGWEEGGLPVE